MNKRINPRERELVCARTGRKFTYCGVGRPPKYHPEVAEQVRKEQRSAAQKRKRLEAIGKRNEALRAAA